MFCHFTVNAFFIYNTKQEVISQQGGRVIWYNLIQCIFTFRSFIKKCVNANEDDVLLFTGSGVTGAIHKLVSALNINPKETVSIITLYPDFVEIKVCCKY